MVLTLIRATRKTTLNCMSAVSVCFVPNVHCKCLKNKWEGNRVPLGERKLDCKQKSHTIIVRILCDMGLLCSKLNNSNLIKDRNIIFAVSKRYINMFNTK